LIEPNKQIAIPFGVASGEETPPLTLYAFQCNSMLNNINLSRSTALPNHLDLNIIMMASAQSGENDSV